MYKKIWGLQKLEELDFPVPPYEVIDISEDCPNNIREYLLQKIEKATIPSKPEDRVGVTIRISMPGRLDKLAKHGGLHQTDKEEIVRRITEKYKQYGPKSKIIIQHTVDAKCSGAIVKETSYAILECILGDAPPLLEGSTNNYEKWKLHLESQNWKKEKNYSLHCRETNILTNNELSTFSKLIEKLPNSTYVEWSISKNSKFYFYEYSKLKSQPDCE